MLAAAGAWDGVAAELGAAASGYHAVLAELTALWWSGPTATAMLAAVTPYVAWLSRTAEQAEQAGTQAKAAAAAYETAFAMTVPPPAIAANRAQLMTLIATNFFGQNAPAIAATEAQYAEFWAQDAAAMFAYAHSSALASVLSSFTSPPRITNAAGLARQEAAVGISGTVTAGSTEHALTATAAQAASSPGALGSLQQFSASAVNSIWSDLSTLGSLPTLSTADTGILVNTWGLSYFGAGVIQLGYLFAQQVIPESIGPAVIPPIAAAPTSAAAVPAGTGATLVSAHVGQSGKVGLMSVPPNWATPASPASPGASGASLIMAHDAAPGATHGLLPAVPRERSGATFGRRRYGLRITVMARPPDGF